MGVLGRQHEEGRGQRVGSIADGHLPLLHGLEQGGLHLRRRPVDLVGEDDVGEDGALARREGLVALVVDESTGDVRRQQIGRELDAAVARVERLGEGPNAERLGQAGHTLEQQMALRQQPHEQPIEQLLLAHDDLADLIEDRGQASAFLPDLLGECSYVLFLHRRGLLEWTL